MSLPRWACRRAGEVDEGLGVGRRRLGGEHQLGGRPVRAVTQRRGHDHLLPVELCRSTGVCPRAPRWPAPPGSVRRRLVLDGDLRAASRPAEPATPPTTELFGPTQRPPPDHGLTRGYASAGTTVRMRGDSARVPTPAGDATDSGVLTRPNPPRVELGVTWTLCPIVHIRVVACAVMVCAHTRSFAMLAAHRYVRAMRARSASRSRSFSRMWWSR